MKIKTLQLHKRSVNSYNDIQDKYHYDINKGIFAISDGATQGFRSEIWAKMMTEKFIQNPEFNTDNFISNLQKYAQEFSNISFEENPNPALRQVELRKKADGSYATFMGVQIINSTMHYISSGDVCGFIISDKGISSFPFQSIGDLDNDKGFLSTQRLLNNQVKVEQFKQNSIQIKEGDIIILMTDAIARLALRDNKIMNTIINLADFDSFKDYIMKEWESKRLEEDDITICVIENTHNTEEKNIHPPKDFEFPKEVALSKILNPNNVNKEIDMDKVIDYLRPFENKLKQLKKENSILKMIASGILLLTLLLVGLGFFLFHKIEENFEKVIKTTIIENKKTEKSNLKINTELEKIDKELIFIKDSILTKNNESQSIK